MRRVGHEVPTICVAVVPCCDRWADHAADWATMAFFCDTCGIWICGWCEGAADARPGDCDACWHDHEAAA